MSVTSFLLGRRPFMEKGEIIKFIVNSKDYDQETEELFKSDALLIFQTSKQQTWLVATSERLYCLLDDLREEEPHINWSIPKVEIISKDKVTLQVKSRNDTADSGLVAIGPKHPSWYYSKRLFSAEPIEKRICDLLQKTMLNT